MGELSLAFQADPPLVVVTRGTDVSDDFWLLVWSNWGSEGRNPVREVRVPVETFLTRISWFPAACRQHTIRPNADEGVRTILLRRQEASEQVKVAVSSDPIGREQALGRLQGTRFKRELRDFQVRDLARLLSLPNGANFSVPGAGKTAVTYAVYEAERRQARIEKMLVVAPISAFSAWEEEAETCFRSPVPKVQRFWGEVAPDTEVLVVNYQRLASSYARLSEWVAQGPTMVVLDEAHRAKRGWSGQWGAACLNLALHAARRDVLSGTPAPQSPADLSALIDFLWPGQARNVLPTAALTGSSAPGVNIEVANRIRSLFTRTTKRELDIPGPTFTPILVPLEGLQREIYDALRNRFASEAPATQSERVDLIRLGRVVMYLLEAATNPALLPVGSAAGDAFEFPPLEIPAGSTLSYLISNYGQHETPRKFIQLAQIIRDSADQGHKTLIWTNFVRNIAQLERMLAAYKPAAIHGSVPSNLDAPVGVRTRDRELARFRGDDECKVLIANPAAMSEGVSLHDVCHDAVYLDRTFNAGQYLQSLDRINRLGLAPEQQTRVTILMTQDTVDTVVDQRVRAKASALSEMLNDPAIVTMALPDDEDYGAAVEPNEDMAALFAHLRGEDVH